MANSFQDISQMMVPLDATLKPRQITGNTNGDAIDVTKVGTDRLNATLITGAAVALTSLDVKLQASNNGGSTWTDCLDSAGNTVAFNQVTAGNTSPQTLSFQLPAASGSTAAYTHVRAVATLVGTSIYICVPLECCSKFGSFAKGYQNAPPTIN